VAGSDTIVAELRRMLDAGRSAVVFTGAGVSTDSGIPDYRSPGGIWTKYRPVDFNDFLASEDMRREFWRRKFATHGTLQRARPSRGHRAIAELVRRGTVATVITQNVDGLHEASGVPVERLIEIHGNTTYARCLDCGVRHELEPIRRAFEADETLPHCHNCGGVVKTATISFGQSMPEAEMRRAEEATLACDLFLAVGSSLTVYPAAGFPALAKRKGARLAIVNREPTELDQIADLVVHGEIGPTLGAVAGVD
jgi:NAD-dependent deacetylase